ncbi:lipoprotein insertase outer membrane protein LolB [Legionella taurinensis]|uniref:Outer-membrane lipoprotein LolB n=1 Tax=Legionella taurinensis TaxID=70611 RepID=A0A3A5LNC3_9GAMM|nr:lipoprotein insertase outer membrane protein LolB [Legionella taurinensis]RJT48642.1 outer membrane lipoprotein LolB [Legionella taurinensis]RJT69629.1 outer membrane lipoprotein LolB [Legionella taurinensis]
MNALKCSSLCLLLLLTACAPRHHQALHSGTEGSLPGEGAVNGQPLTTEEAAASPAVNVSPAEQAKQTASISSWELSGAMAARGKKKSWTASVNWLQNGPGSYQIRLFGPLGSGTVMIDKKGGVVTLRDGPKKVSSSSADALLRKETGVGLPVANLYYWVRGLPAPGAVQTAQRDPKNRLLLLRQAGYTIQYLGYSAVGKAALPSQIRLQGHDIFIKMVIKKWRV